MTPPTPTAGDAAAGDGGDPTLDASPETASGGGSAIDHEMTERMIRDAGLMVDLPFESGSPDPARLRYEQGIAGTAYEIPPDWAGNSVALDEQGGLAADDDRPAAMQPDTPVA